MSEPTYPCRCGDSFGWLEQVEIINGAPVKTVVPCRDCNHEARVRWAAGAFKSGPNYVPRSNERTA